MNPLLSRDKSHMAFKQRGNSFLLSSLTKLSGLRARIVPVMWIVTTEWEVHGESWGYSVALFSFPPDKGFH